MCAENERIDSSKLSTTVTLLESSFCTEQLQYRFFGDSLTNLNDKQLNTEQRSSSANRVFSRKYDTPEFNNAATIGHFPTATKLSPYWSVVIPQSTVLYA